MVHTEWAASAVAAVDPGLDPSTTLHMAVNLFAYVRGSTLNVEMELESEQDTGLTDDQWLEAQGAHVARVLASGRYPQLARIVATPEVDLDVDTLFDFGLARLLDGYAALIASVRYDEPVSLGCGSASRNTSIRFQSGSGGVCSGRGA
jgi:hypothetical protein